MPQEGYAGQSATFRTGVKEIMTRMPYRYSVGVLAEPVCSEQVSSGC
jgi:hypothetical protein